MKIPKPQKLPSGNYNIRLRLGDQDISITERTSKECIRVATLYKAEYKAGKQMRNMSADNLTLKECIKQYIESSKATLSPSTILGYTRYLNTRFLKYQNQKLSSIRWQKMIDDELKLVSEKTVYNAWGLVHAALSSVGYPIPKVKTAKIPVKEVAFLEPEEIPAFCKAVKGQNSEIGLLLELHGLRLSEVLGLDWSRVFLDQEKIIIRGSKVRSLDGYSVKNTNKNASSSRAIPIMIPQLKAALEAVENKKGPVVTMSAPGLLSAAKRTCRKAGITEVTNHGLRHSFASLCYYLNIPERQLMEWGGWSDYQTMHRIYIRLASSARNESSLKVTHFFTQESGNVAIQ